MSRCTYGPINIGEKYIFDYQRVVSFNDFEGIVPFERIHREHRIFQSKLIIIVTMQEIFILCGNTISRLLRNFYQAFFFLFSSLLLLLFLLLSSRSLVYTCVDMYHLEIVITTYRNVLRRT